MDANAFICIFFCWFSLNSIKMCTLLGWKPSWRPYNKQDSQSAYIKNKTNSLQPPSVRQCFELCSDWQQTLSSFLPCQMCGKDICSNISQKHANVQLLWFIHPCIVWKAGRNPWTCCSYILDTHTHIYQTDLCPCFNQNSNPPPTVICEDRICIELIFGVSDLYTAHHTKLSAMDNREEPEVTGGCSDGVGIYESKYYVLKPAVGRSIQTEHWGSSTGLQIKGVNSGVSCNRLPFLPVIKGFATCERSSTIPVICPNWPHRLWSIYGCLTRQTAHTQTLFV